MHERDIEGSGGLRIRLCEWGEPDHGPPLLILHGYLEQGAAWDRVARELPGRTVAPDHRGHGKSGHVGIGGFYHFWDYVADVDHVVRELGDRVDLVGHSMGGTIACLYAGARPEHVRRLALIEGIGPPDLTPLALARSRRFLDRRRDPPRHEPMADLDAAVKRMRRHNPRLPDDEALRLAARITKPVDGGVVWTWDPRHREVNPVPFDPELFRTWVQAIEAPVLAIDGSDSPFRIPDLQRRLSWLRSVQTASVPGAGHLVHHDAPRALGMLLREWFADRGRP